MVAGQHLVKVRDQGGEVCSADLFMRGIWPDDHLHVSVVTDCDRYRVKASAKSVRRYPFLVSWPIRSCRGKMRCGARTLANALADWVAGPAYCGSSRLRISLSSSSL